MNERVTYRTPGYGHRKNGAVSVSDITWSQAALNWGKHYGTIGFSATTLDKQTVIAYVTWQNMEKGEKKLRPLAPPQSL